MYLGGVCLITDRQSCPLTCEEMAVLALKSGIGWIQLRCKDMSRIALYRAAWKLRGITRDFGACLIINDYADIAAAVDADGVHLGQDDLPIAAARKIMGPDKIIGVSTHSIGEAVTAESEGADYVGFGAVYATTTKHDAVSPRGTWELNEIRSRLEIPVVAIGGISAERLHDVFSSGASAVAVASAILKGDIAVNVRCFMDRLRGESRADC